MASHFLRDEQDVGMRNATEQRGALGTCDVRHSDARSGRGTVAPMRPLIALGLLLLAMGPAVEYGAIWSLRADPIPDVTVRLRDGQVVTGELSRTWSKDWIVRTRNGELQFPEAGGYQSMTFPAPRETGARDTLTAVTTLFARWRSFLPLALLGVVVLGCAFGGLTGRLWRALASAAQGASCHD